MKRKSNGSSSQSTVHATLDQKTLPSMEKLWSEFSEEPWISSQGGVSMEQAMNNISTEKKIEGKLIWFHGASVGEILSVIPIIKNYEKNKFVSQILVTSSTLSSSKIFKNYKFKKTIHQFYPVDHFFFTNKFNFFTDYINAGGNLHAGKNIK